jgi:hypothetical protein
LGADNKRIGIQLKAAGGGAAPGATDAQIAAQLRNADGSWRTKREVASALRAGGLGADSIRIMTQLQAAVGVRRRRGATDAQIAEHLRNADGSLRIAKDVANALHAAGLGAQNHRIFLQLQAARGQ